MALIDTHLGALLAHFHDLIDILKVQLGIDTLGEHVVGDCQDIDITGPLAVAKKRTLDALRAREKRELRRRDAASPVIVRVYAQDDAVPVFEMTAHPLDLVRVDVGRRHFHGGRKVKDDRIFRRRLPLILDRRADLQGKIQLCAGKALGRILKIDLAGEFLRPLFDPFGPLYRDIDDLFSVHAKDHVPLQSGSGIVDMDHCLFDALNGLERPLDLVFLAL